MIKRKKTRKIMLGQVPIGGGSPVSVQSMTKTDTRNVASTVRQIKALERAGCEIIRVAVPDMEAARVLGKIRRSIGIPLVADIHFDWRLALEAVTQGVDGLRINPGNIGARWKVKEVLDALRGPNIPIRIGVNAGSLEKDLLRKFGHPTSEALYESAMRHIKIVEDLGYNNLKVSLKASGVMETVEAYRMFSRKSNYPLHIGISEAGPSPEGLVKSSVGLGILLSEGIGDTMRVSLTENPVEEVRTAFGILGALGIRRKGIDLISCPTCGRCGVDLRRLVSGVRKGLSGVEEPLTVAVMGCAVNGPGEAREADFGIASGKGSGIVFRKGKIVARTTEEKLLDKFLDMMKRR